MRITPQTIAHKNVDAIIQVNHLVRYGAEIGRVSDGLAIAFEPVPSCLARTMLHLTPLDTKSGKHPKPVKRVQTYDSRIAILTGKDIPETLSQSADCLGRCIARYRAAATVSHHPQIIDTVAMICMIMRPEYRVDRRYPVSQQLGTAIARSIDQKPLSSAVFDENRHP